MRAKRPRLLATAAGPRRSVKTRCFNAEYNQRRCEFAPRRRGCTDRVGCPAITRRSKGHPVLRSRATHDRGGTSGCCGKRCGGAILGLRDPRTYDPFAPTSSLIPITSYRELLRSGVPYRNESRGIWVLSRYDHVRAGPDRTTRCRRPEGITYARAGTSDDDHEKPPITRGCGPRLSRRLHPRRFESWQRW